MKAKINSGQLNLKVYFKDDLHDYPEDHEQMTEYIKAEFLMLEMLSGLDKFEKVSQLAVYSRILRSYSQAHELFQMAADYFEKNDSKMCLINLIRWADVFRFEKRFDEALAMLEKVEKILNENNYSDYQDFYWQHLGKLYFDIKDFKMANSCFDKALELRKLKKNPELISSTEFAIKFVNQKLNL